jgi:hypothetical protein
MELENKNTNNVLENVINEGERKGLILLSTEYNEDKLQWICKKNKHIINLSYKELRLRKGCSKCPSGARYTVEELHSIAEELGLVFIGDKARDKNTEWACKEEGHKFKSSVAVIKKAKTKCPDCYWDEVTYSIEEIDKHASENGITCMEVTYRNKEEKMMWRCSYGHLWPAVFDSIIRGRRCKQCGNSTGETSTLISIQDFFEHIPQINIIKNARKKAVPELKGYELDIYLPEYRLALEYNGIQHYEYNDRFHKNGIKDFIHQVMKDKIKYRLCVENGITLIRVKYTIKNIRQYVYDKLTQLEYKCPIDRETFIDDKTSGNRISIASNKTTQHIDKVNHRLSLLNFTLVTPFAKNDEHEIKCNTCNTITFRTLHQIACCGKPGRTFCHLCRQKEYEEEKRLILLKNGFLLNIVIKENNQTKFFKVNRLYCGINTNKYMSHLGIVVKNGIERIKNGCNCWKRLITEQRIKERELIISHLKKNKLGKYFTDENYYWAYFEVVQSYLQREHDNREKSLIYFEMLKDMHDTYVDQAAYIEQHGII